MFAWYHHHHLPGRRGADAREVALGVPVEVAARQEARGALEPRISRAAAAAAAAAAAGPPGGAAGF